MEHELHERGALDVFRFDVLDARDLQDVILVVTRQVPFHLGGIHAAVRLGQKNCRRAEVREKSTGVRRSASREQRATAITATSMVIGRRIAEVTSHIGEVFLLFSHFAAICK